MDQAKLDSLALKDILTYGIMHIDLLENKKWAVASRSWIKDIYSVVNPYDIEQSPEGIARRLVIQKSTQCGMSTMAAVRMFHFADYWSIRSIYMLPRQQDYLDFVTTRIDPMISSSERLKNLLGIPDSTRAKKLGASYLFFMESTVEPRMMPADVTFIDEFDLSDSMHVATAQNRMDDSKWRLSFFFSTPTLPNFGINAMYNTSDKRQWFVKCSACNYQQVLDWDKNLRVIGNMQKPDKVFFGCVRCDTPITLEHIQEGMWVPEYPERSSKIIGFAVSQMMTHTPERLYETYIDPTTKEREFHRKNLGKPIELGIGSVEREDILSSCFHEPAHFEDHTDGKSTYYMGVDQGNELQVLIGKREKGSNIAKIVHLESVPIETGFNRIGQLIRLFKVSKAVIDADPNRHSARTILDDFLGTVLLADYTTTTLDWSLKSDPKKGVVTNVVIGRSEGFDRLIDSIKDNEWVLPGELPILPPDTELIIDHITAIKRDVEERKTPTGIREVAVWKELRPSHFAHAWLYLKTALEVDAGKGYRVATIGGGSKQKEEIIPGTAGGPPQQTILGITALLAEVPNDQLEMLVAGLLPIKIPMPLRWKLERCLSSGYIQEDIIWVAKFILRDRISGP